ncbi:GGDEF domain-containing protein [Aliidiomarina celeris]|uniref:GGDEF domain-containing protein n=1 Tax=Aliidiomarina celeris TaxID=2249428 RepID=UPI000DEACE3B|nr:GGDEF domain-containing protein [Aliidiomarina celeris]
MVIVEQQQDQNGVQVLACSERFQRDGKLSERLQTTLDIEQLLALYGKEVRDSLAIDSLTFAADELVFAVFGYVEQKPQHNAAIYADGEYLGQLVYSKHSGFSAADKKQLNTFHQQLIFPLRNAMRFARVRRQAMHDHMTGVGNRLLMSEQLTRAAETKRRNNLSYMLMLLDLDGFKTVNDTAGHAKGDRILQRFAEVIKRALRAYDGVYRYGGDEFVLLLQDADKHSAQHVYDRIQNGVAGDALLTEYNIGCSAGAVELNPTQDENTLLARADNALYEAKQSGKGRLCFAI